MSAKSILITGSTSGIGLAGAEALGRQGWRVLIHARSEARGNPVLAELKTRIPAGNFELVTGDLSSLKEISALANQVKAKLNSLDVLWNNAGGLVPKKKLSADGVEWQMAVNHLAVQALTQLLLPLLEKAEQGRVIVTSSMAQLFAQLSPASWFSEPGKSYRGFGVYGKTKLANVLFTREMAERLKNIKNIKITVHCFHPGFVRTGFGSSGVPQKPSFISVVAALLALPPEKGADTGVFLATAPEVGTVSGLYWIKRKKAAPAKAATIENARALWKEGQDIIERVLGSISISTSNTIGS